MAKSKHRPGSKRALLKARREEKQKREKITKGFLIFLVISAFGFSAFSYLNRPQALLLSQERLADNPSKGNPDALVVLTEFGDFGCEACQSWHEAGIIDQIMAIYDGQIRFEWQDFPVITSFSPRAAEAGQCAHDQGKFWAFHDKTYEREIYGALAARDLRNYANLAGLDMEVFDQCFDSHQHQETVEVDLNIARSLGLRGTPAFLVNGNQRQH